VADILLNLYGEGTGIAANNWILIIVGTLLARGDAPFTLTYGSAHVQARQAPVIGLLNDLREALDKVPVRTAQLGQAISGNSDKLLPAPPPLPWRTWLLWASLLTGVLVLGILAWRLQRQMRTGAD